MTIKRLTDKHPLLENLNKVFSLMDELDIKIEVNNYGTIIYNGQDAYALKDIDSPFSAVNYIPPQLEFKVIYEEDDE